MNKWSKAMALLGTIDEVGNRYGRLVVTEPGFIREDLEMWKCICDCGEEVKAWGTDQSVKKQTTYNFGTPYRWQKNP